MSFWQALAWNMGPGNPYITTGVEEFREPSSGPSSVFSVIIKALFSLKTHQNSNL